MTTAETRFFPCGGCAAKLEFAPGTDALLCPYCGQSNDIAPDDDAAIEELDFGAFLAQAGSEADSVEVATVVCESCGAASSASKHKGLSHCPFCGSAVSAQVQTQRLIKPAALLPFKLTKDEAMVAFRAWINDLSFAPGDLEKRLKTDSALEGVYTPYWTFDCQTRSRYSGERGDNYTETETRYSISDDGDQIEEEYEVTKTEWTSVRGKVKHSFDDVLVAANDSLPADKVKELEPWDLEALRPAREEYASGFVVEAYQIDLAQGFGLAREIMDEAIRDEIRRDIGGDDQRIDTVDTKHRDIAFKHILLPIWICSYQHNGKAYRFIINARTGEVQGERPWSAWKIAALVVYILFSLLMLIPPATPLGLLMIFAAVAYGIYKAVT